MGSADGRVVLESVVQAYADGVAPDVGARSRCRVVAPRRRRSRPHQRAAGMAMLGSAIALLVMAALTWAACAADDGIAAGPRRDGWPPSSTAPSASTSCARPPSHDRDRPALLHRHGITDGEYARIQELLGRDPNLLELGLFSVMWSEHCSYKSSRVHLKTLPTTGPRVVQGPGENAGAVDIGDGLAAVFKIESHNHPSFIEPYQGAATGVGGIIRDIFTMGARPMALLNALRFGSLDTPLARRIFEGVVAGIGGYGNSIGIPTIGGEIVFDEVYAGNPLVNVLCLGLARHDEIIKGQATGVGNPVYYVGAKTGRDGIHGATMASAEFDESSAEKRPAVQVGDPFMEKLLMEACLEVMKTDALVGIQDMGAAGLTCATSEMSSRGGSGMDVEVSLVPQRETGMTPYEIMLSESQERMLLVAKAGREREVEAVFEKWDLHAVRVGHVTDTGRVRLHHHGALVADVPTRALTDEGPVYRRPMARPSWQSDVQQLDFADAAGAAAAAGGVRGAARLAGHRQQALGLRAVRPHASAPTPSRSPARTAGVVRIKGARAGPGRLGRRQRPLLLPRSVSRRDARRGRVGAQRRLRRRRADWRHQQPELRQPRAARDHVAVRRGRARHRRRLPRARRADHRRQRQPLQRDRGPGDLPDAGAGRGRAARRTRRRPSRARFNRPAPR